MSVAQEEVRTFIRQLAELLTQGAPIPGALKTLADQQDNQYLQSVIKQMLRGVQTGFRVSDVMSQHPDVFDKPSVASVRHAEELGDPETLIQVLTRLSREATRPAALHRLMPEVSEADTTTITDHLTVAARSIEAALLKSGAKPGVDYTYVNLFELAAPFALELWKRDDSA